MDDLWFAYPSRPTHMVLKVTTFSLLYQVDFFNKLRPVSPSYGILLQILQGITLKLQPGSKVALVGPSGGGKVSVILF